MRRKHKLFIILLTLAVLAGQLIMRGNEAFASEFQSLENTADVEYEYNSPGALDDWYYTETQNGIVLTQYRGTSTDIVIPGTIDGKQVFLQNSGVGTGLDRFPANTTSIVVGSTDQKVKLTDGTAACLFLGLTNLTYLDARGLDMSDVTSAYRMFSDCKRLTSLDVSGWDTGGVTDMSFMFQSCNSLSGLDVSGWDTGKVTNMYSMFRGCNSLTGLDVSGWDTESVENISCMFYGCTGLKELDLSGWDTSSITGDNMDALFYNCTSLTSLNVSGWDTSGVTFMQNMFFNCSSLKELDLSSWDTGNVISMSYMFYYCSSLTELNLNGWNTSKVESVLFMYNNCGSLQILDLSGHDYGNVKAGGYAGIFDLLEDSAMLPTLIISNDPLIKSICDGPVTGRVPAGPTYHFGEGVFTDENGIHRSELRYFDTLLLTDINDFTESAIINKYTPDKEGAVFSGWYLDEACTQPFEEAGGRMGLAELIRADLYAKYTNQYTSTDENSDGSTGDIIEKTEKNENQESGEAMTDSIPETSDTSKVEFFVLSLFFSFISFIIVKTKER